MNKEHNCIIDNISNLFLNFVGTTKGICKEIEVFIYSKIEQTLNNFDIIRREDFEIIREMTIKNISDQEKLKQQLDILAQKLEIYEQKKSNINKID